MIFDVMSRRDAIAFSADPDILPTAIISIGEVGEADAVFADNPQIKAVLHLHFLDTEERRLDAMQEEDADRIVAFVWRWREQVDEILVHCEAGASRSAGVAAALMRWLNGNDDEIKLTRRYQPNRRCERLVSEALRRKNLIC